MGTPAWQMIAGGVLFAGLFFVVVEDFKYRAVRWWAFPLLGITALTIEYSEIKVVEIILNTGFILLQLALLTIYFSIKEKRMVKITEKHLGLGDILFWMVLALLFSTLNFLLFFMASMAFVSIVVLCWKLLNIKPAMNTVPLAGIQSLALALTMAAKVWTNNISFRSDWWIENWLLG